MKLLTVLFVCSLAFAAVKALPAFEGKEAFLAMAQRCREQTGATDADIEGIVKHQPASTKEAKCMRSCLMKEFQIMGADGKFVGDNAMKIAEVETKGDPERLAVATGIIEICKNTPVSDDHCEAAEQYAHCFVEETKKKGVTAVEF